MNPYKLREIYKYLTRAKKANPELSDVFPASKAPIPPKTQNVEEIEAINRFNKDNPRIEKAGGGMLVQPSNDGSRPGYAKMKLDDDTIQKIKNKITLKKGQKWNFYDSETNPKGHTYGVPKGDTNYDIARNLKPGRLELKLKKATKKYQEIKANPKLLKQKKAYDRELYMGKRDEVLQASALKYETDKEFREKKLEWARQDKIKNPEKYKQKLNDYFAKKGKFPPGNNYKENVWRDMFRSSQKSGQTRFLLVDEKGNLLTKDKFPKVDGKVRWDVGGAYKKVKFYDTVTEQFVKFDNSIKGEGISFEKYLDQKSVGGKGAYQNAINGYKNKDDIKNLTFKDSKGKTIRLGTIVQERLNDGVNFINSGVNVQHPDLNNAFWKNEVTLASANNQLNYLEQTLERQLRNAGNDVDKRNKVKNNFKSEINRQPGGITKVIEGETFGIEPTKKSVVEAIGKETKLTKFKDFNNLLAKIGCPGKGKAYGGRIQFQEGLSPEVCMTRGAQVIQEKRIDSPAQKANFNKMMKIASVGKNMALLKDILGPYGLGGDVLLEGMIAVNKTLTGGTPFKESWQDSWLSNIVGGAYDEAGQKLGRQKLFELRSGLSEGAEEFGDYNRKVEEYYNLISQKNNLDLFKGSGDFADTSQEFKSVDNKIKTAERELLRMETRINAQGGFEAAENEFNRKTAERQDADAATSLQSIGRLYVDQNNLNQMLQDDFSGLSSDALPMQKEPRPVLPNYETFKPELPTLSKYKNMYEEAGITPPDDKVLEQDLNQERFRQLFTQPGFMGASDTFFGDTVKMAGGGIAKLAGVSSGPAPTSGPNSQGLLSLKNRVRNY